MDYTKPKRRSASSDEEADQDIWQIPRPLPLPTNLLHQASYQSQNPRSSSTPIGLIPSELRPRSHLRAVSTPNTNHYRDLTNSELGIPKTTDLNYSSSEEEREEEVELPDYSVCYYNILGLPENHDLTRGDIDRAYQKICKLFYCISFTSLLYIIMREFVFTPLASPPSTITTSKPNHFLVRNPPSDLQYDGAVLAEIHNVLRNPFRRGAYDMARSGILARERKEKEEERRAEKEEERVKRLRKEQEERWEEERNERKAMARSEADERERLRKGVAGLIELVRRRDSVGMRMSMGMDGIDETDEDESAQEIEEEDRDEGEHHDMRFSLSSNDEELEGERLSPDFEYAGSDGYKLNEDEEHTDGSVLSEMEGKRGEFVDRELSAVAGSYREFSISLESSIENLQGNGYAEEDVGNLQTTRSSPESSLLRSLLCESPESLSPIISESENGELARAIDTDTNLSGHGYPEAIVESATSSTLSGASTHMSKPPEPLGIPLSKRETAGIKSPSGTGMDTPTIIDYLYPLPESQSIEQSFKTMDNLNSNTEVLLSMEPKKSIPPTDIGMSTIDIIDHLYPISETKSTERPVPLIITGMDTTEILDFLYPRATEEVIDILYSISGTKSTRKSEKWVPLKKPVISKKQMKEIWEMDYNPDYDFEDDSEADTGMTTESGSGTDTDTDHEDIKPTKRTLAISKRSTPSIFAKNYEYKGTTSLNTNPFTNFSSFSQEQLEDSWGPNYPSSNSSRSHIEHEIWEPSYHPIDNFQSYPNLQPYPINWDFDFTSDVLGAQEGQKVQEDSQIEDTQEDDVQKQDPYETIWLGTSLTAATLVGSVAWVWFANGGDMQSVFQKMRVFLRCHSEGGLREESFQALMRVIENILRRVWAGLLPRGKN